MSWDVVPNTQHVAAPALADWETLWAQAQRAVDPEFRTVMQQRIAALFGGRVPEADEIFPSAVRSCAESIDQFVMDVSALTDEHRDAVTTALGHGTYPFFQALYVFDLDFRLRAALRQLFSEDDENSAYRPNLDEKVTAAVDLWPALDRFLTTVAAMVSLDPVTTELVRLRGARAHNCRICQSRRNVTAVENGAGESVFDQIDFFETSDLDERHKVALRLTDAMIWQPAAYPTGLVEQVGAYFSPAEALELVLDVVRNAANKVAVALEADQPVVSGGVEYVRVDADGTLAYGLPAPAQASLAQSG
jgi:alkylhydroperoxidase family enzyme